MNCKKCGSKSLLELCWKCKPKKPLSKSKGLNKKISNKITTKSLNNNHFIKTNKKWVTSNLKRKNEINEDYKQQNNILKSQRFISYKTNKAGKELLKETINKLLLERFFIEQWNKRPHFSEVSGDFLGNNYSTIYQHHILPKIKFPKACFDEENIVFLTANEHLSVEMDIYKYPLVNEKRNQLKIKYNL